MDIRTWIIKVKDKNTLNALMQLTQKQDLEEFYICKIEKDGAVSNEFIKDDIVAILSSNGKKVQDKLGKIATVYLLDDLKDEMFNIDEDGAELKGVSYPSSEEEELLFIDNLE
jgi:hypothetical protein